ncbi:D-aspartate oxidase isoform X5 [Patella vulgata]|uniref:D-aspartate oxidase isoform X5 n=1 Tax=Patella vulgata TaxID=6465 RepID=UPI0024A8AAF4|nr:D-aspartate oxidase isoform X5 [Patella vulgata]
MKKICVVGAGIIGLSSAIRIQDRYPKIDITIIADKFSPNTTSDGAGALFEVFAVGDTPLELVQKWAKETWDHLKNVAFSVEADSARVQHVSGYWVTGDPPMTSETSPDEENTSRRLTSEEMQLLFPRAKSGKFFTSYLVDCTSYLPWLMKQYMNKGGKIINKTIQSLDEVHAPWIKHFYVQDIGDEFTYIFPGSKNVVLGATFQKGNWNTKPNHEDRAALFERCCQIHPSLKMATVDYSWVGLRPCRSRVRLELEPPSAHTKCRVIHNYGHGGAGVTLHWGCAQTVVDLLRDLINNTYINSKL